MAECVATFTADKAMSFVLGKVTKHIMYFWNSVKNVKKMKEEAEKLKIMREAVGQQIRSAKRIGDDLIAGVQNWVEDVDADISKAEKYIVRDVNFYRYGKRAALLYDTLVKHQNRGIGYQICVSVDTPPPRRLDADVYGKKNLDDILTQKSALGDIITAIEDESNQIIGICGMGGVGKTMLAMEVGARLRNIHPFEFDEVAFTTVSQKVDYERMKKDTEVARKRMRQKDKVIIILDDVWGKLDLERLDIPRLTEYKKCKILLTSRNKEVCEKMNADHKICVNVLPEEEAWILFKRIVGDVVENTADLQDVAKKVAEECRGLPLLLEAVGNALKTKNIEDWKKAYKRLREHGPSLRSMDAEIRHAFDCLQLSYDLLNDEEAQLCFLLCCMFPEDKKNSLKDLVYYAVGLAKFDRLKSMEDARERVENAVKILTSSGLLLNVDSNRYTKMHDVVRDVALIIASKSRNNFLVEAGKGLTKWLPRKNELESYTGISLMNNMISKLPDYELHLPRLEIFLVSYNLRLTKFSGKIFQGMQEVKVLDMRCCNLSVLHGFQFFTKLRVLNLEGNKNVVDISILGKMKDLES